MTNPTKNNIFILKINEAVIYSERLRSIINAITAIQPNIEP